MSILSYELPENIAKEFTVNESGNGFVSRRGISRLCGVSRQAIQQLLKSIESEGASKALSEVLKPFAGQAFEGGKPIPDVLVSAIIKYYAYQGNKVAQSVDLAIGAIGLRTVIQKSLGWEQPQQLTDRQIVELLCLPFPTKWQPRFSVEFYNELQRLTGLIPEGHKRPALWAKITKELVYDHLPKGVYDEVKAWQQATDPNKKLHQYLSDQGVEVLGEHLKRVITLMQCAAHLSEVERLLNQSITKAYQSSLFYH